MPIAKASLAGAALFAAALSLSACGSPGDIVSSALTAPGQYDLYDCPAMQTAARGLVARQRKLEELMARANQGPAGGLVSATTYQPEYVTVRGKMNRLRRAAAANNCTFVPGAPPAAHAPPPPKQAAKRAKRPR